MTMLSKQDKPFLRIGGSPPREEHSMLTVELQDDERIVAAKVENHGQSFPARIHFFLFKKLITSRRTVCQHRALGLSGGLARSLKSSEGKSELSEQESPRQENEEKADIGVDVMRKVTRRRKREESLFARPEDFWANLAASRSHVLIREQRTTICEIMSQRTQSVQLSDCDIKKSPDFYP